MVFIVGIVLLVLDTAVFLLVVDALVLVSLSVWVFEINLALWNLVVDVSLLVLSDLGGSVKGSVLNHLVPFGKVRFIIDRFIVLLSILLLGPIWNEVADHCTLHRHLLKSIVAVSVG